MGFFSRLFGRKDDNFGLDEPLPGAKDRQFDESFPQDNLGLDEKPSFPEPEARLPSHLEEEPEARPLGRTAAPASLQRDSELINSKLDTIKAILNSMDQRIANLEKAAGVEQNKKMPW